MRRTPDLQVRRKQEAAAGSVGGSLAGLSDRQRREIEYHRERAKQFAEARCRPVSYEVATSLRRRWWNPYWFVYTWVRDLGTEDGRVLVLGCGFGDDPPRLSALRSRVHTVDLSWESLEIAQFRANATARGPIGYCQMVAENLAYREDTFDLIFAVDILHHVDISETIAALQRVARDGCVVLCLEPYTHTWLQRIRESRLVEHHIYERVEKLKGTWDDPYITPDERKLNEADIRCLRGWLSEFEVDYFEFLAGRVIPLRFVSFAKCDRMFLRLLGPLGSILGSRVVVKGRVRK